MSKTLPSQDFIADLTARGLLNDCTNLEGLAQHLEQPRSLYCGFDPTADSLHIGNLVPLVVLKRFQLAGHTPIALVGGATGMIGDPSFKKAERQLNSAEVVADWVDKIKAQVSQFIAFEGDNAAEVVNNLDWVGPMDVVTFLRDVGKHFSVNAMMKKESVRARLEDQESGISFTEFSYMLIQSLDFAKLYKEKDVTLQIGGSDQWGNITSGIDLTRRQHGGEVYGLTMPLVTKADGSKFGKSETGTVWLDSQRTSPYAFYQFWLNVADADVEKFLKYFSFFSLDEIDDIVKEHAEAPHLRLGQKKLAEDVTTLVHGHKGLVAAQRITDALFAGSLGGLEEEDFVQLRQDGMPASELPEASMPLVDVLVTSGLAQSKRLAREFITGGGVSLNGEKITSTDYTLDAKSGMYGQYHIIRRGKKNFHMVWK